MDERTKAFLKQFGEEIRVSIFKDSGLEGIAAKSKFISESNFRKPDFIDALEDKSCTVREIGSDYLKVSQGGEDFVMNIMDFDFDHELFFR